MCTFSHFTTCHVTAALVADHLLSYFIFGVTVTDRRMHLPVSHTLHSLLLSPTKATAVLPAAAMPVDSCACAYLKEAFRCCVHAPKHAKPLTHSKPLAQRSERFLHELPADGIVLLQYPTDCRSTAFQQDFEAAAERMSELSSSFGLVHDMRTAGLFSVRVDEIASAGASIASRGFVKRLALVLDCHPLLRAAIAAGVFAQSPVRPVKVFEDLDAACAWAGAWRELPTGQAGLVPDSCETSEPPRGNPGIKIRYRPFYSFNHLLGGQAHADALAERVGFLRGFTFELALPLLNPPRASNTTDAGGGKRSRTITLEVGATAKAPGAASSTGRKRPENGVSRWSYG
jgi:hypothetical protein